MNSNKVPAIIGLGSYVPDHVLSNSDLEKIVDTSDEWIISRTGIRERRIAEKNETTSTMGAIAAERAIENAGIKSSDIDLIIFATAAPDYIFPSCATLAQSHLNLHEIPAFDCMAACSGFIYGISVAEAFVASNKYKHVLLIAADKLSSFVDYNDRNTCILFGDGASACVIANSDVGLGISKVCLGSDGGLAQLLKLPAGGCKMPASLETVEKKQHFINMEGKEIFKHAVRRMEASSKECIEKAGITEKDITWLVPHQANERIIEAIAKRFSIQDDRVFKTIHKYGNTAASSIGIALSELVSTKEIMKGENILLTAFGGGLSWGSVVLNKM